MAIMHPKMYATGREAIVRLGKWAESRDDQDMLEVIAMWPTIFNVASVMVNRVSPLHVDRNGRPQWFDLLLSIRHYSQLDFFLPMIGLRLRYNPGTILAFSRQLLEHGVGMANADRAAIALYMRDTVHEWVDIGRSNYMEQ
jgi:hypothetical protein